jgi:hypothetical protein
MIPLVRSTTFLRDLAAVALSGVGSNLHDASARLTTGRRFHKLALRPIAMPRSATIPAGSWPRRMPAAIAAGYCGEPTVEAFLKRVGKEYPQPRVKEGRRQLWLRDDLDRAIAPDIVPGDLAEDL